MLVVGRVRAAVKMLRTGIAAIPKLLLWNNCRSPAIGSKINQSFRALQNSYAKTLLLRNNGQIASLQSSKFSSMVITFHSLNPFVFLIKIIGRIFCINFQTMGDLPVNIICITKHLISLERMSHF